MREVRSVSLILGLLGSPMALAESAGPWIDPPSDRELLQMTASLSQLPSEAAPAAPDPRYGSPIGQTGARADEAGAAGERTAALTDEISSDDAAMAATPAPVEVKKSRKPPRAAIRRLRSSRTARSRDDPFVRLFGPPRRNSHVITTTHTR
jgi:hypothetical protein